MKILLMIIIFFIAISGYAQELAEPSDPPLEYKAEISWGSANTAWQNIPMTYTIIDGVPNATHNYWTYGLGDKTFEAIALGSTTDAPKKIKFIINIKTLPSINKWWGNYFRIRIYTTITVNGQVIEGTKSDPSYWVAIINIGTITKPVGI